MTDIRKDIIMKKIALVLAAIMLIAMLGACSNDTPATTEATENKETVTEKGYIFNADGKEVYCNQDGAEALSILGEYQNKFEENSCAFDGKEITYYYSSMRIVTYTDGSSPEKVLSIYLEDDSVATAEGITIGDSADKVASVYGEPQKSEALGVTYTKGNTSLVFTYADDFVDSILYSLEF